TPVHRNPNTIELRVEAAEKFALLFRNHRVQRPINSMTTCYGAAEERRDCANQPRRIVLHSFHDSQDHAFVHRTFPFPGNRFDLQPESTRETSSPANLRLSGLCP